LTPVVIITIETGVIGLLKDKPVGDE